MTSLFQIGLKLILFYSIMILAIRKHTNYNICNFYELCDLHSNFPLIFNTRYLHIASNNYFLTHKNMWNLARKPFLEISTNLYRNNLENNIRKHLIASRKRFYLRRHKTVKLVNN